MFSHVLTTAEAVFYVITYKQDVLPLSWSVLAERPTAAALITAGPSESRLGVRMVTEPVHELPHLTMQLPAFHYLCKRPECSPTWRKSKVMRFTVEFRKLHHTKRKMHQLAALAVHLLCFYHEWFESSKRRNKLCVQKQEY